MALGGVRRAMVGEKAPSMAERVAQSVLSVQN